MTLSDAERLLARSEILDPLENHNRLARRWGRSFQLSIATVVVAAAVALFADGELRTYGVGFAVFMSLFSLVDVKQRRAHGRAAEELKVSLAEFEDPDAASEEGLERPQGR